MFQGPYVRDVFFSFCVYSFDFLTVSSKMSSDSSEFQTNHQDSLNGLSLALKTLGGLSVTQFRVQKRLLKQACNITLASEKSERTEEMEIQVETHVEIQELHFNCEAVVSGKELKSTPFVCMSVT